MQTPLLNERDLDFLLYEFLDTEALLKRERYRDHSREIFDATLDTARKIAAQQFANHYAKGDSCEPQFDGERVQLIPETQQAWDAFAEAGFLAAHWDAEEGGLQLPEIILRSAMAYFSAANIATCGYPFLTIGAANLIRTFGNEQQKALYLPPMADGRFAGTMALTESGQGSSLADIKTIARPAADGSYRLFGQKMFISGGDQSLTDNIVHMVLARIEGAPPGTRGISLFICPKFLVDENGEPGQRNDVALAGLLHKMGYRNTTSTVLNFGENEGAVAYLVGEPNKGLSYMFQMMNEARIGVGLGAAVLAYQGYNASLAYARERPQGRLPSNKNPESTQVNIIEHADVRRMLLAQKAYCEGAMALCLYASSLYEGSHSAEGEQQRRQAELLLDLITPVVKSWPSKYGVRGNDLAIQVLGGAGYIREYPVEQLYRDNRLNPIHEGAEGIHGLDILGRKVWQQGGAGFELLGTAINETVTACNDDAALAGMAASVAEAYQSLKSVTETLLRRLADDPDLTLANATVYLDMFGRVLVAWLWLRQAQLASEALAAGSLDESDDHFYRGKLAAAEYFMYWELPEVETQAALLKRFDAIPLNMRDEWF